MGDMTKLLDERIDEVLETINNFSSGVDERFAQMDYRLDGMDKRLTGVETRLTGVASFMVTKDYLDDKLANLRADLVILARKGNQKLSELIDGLVKKGSLTHDVARRILAMEPFPN